jgi:hypothetical protein
LNPEEVRSMADRPVRVMLRASSDIMYSAMEDFLAPPDLPREKIVEAAQLVFREGGARVADEFDLVLVETGVRLPPGAFAFDPREPESMIGDVLDARPELGLPLARMFPEFRPLVSRRIAHLIAKENTLFSVATSLPNVAPGLALLPWAVPEAVSDTVVLTVNQIRMAFLLAAASDRPVGYREQRVEVGGIIAGALGWRSLARELVSKVPFGGGIVPKAAIAYAATFAEGMSLGMLYRRGRGYSRSEKRRAYTQAVDRGKAVAEAFLEAYRRGKSASVGGGAVAAKS